MKKLLIIAIIFASCKKEPVVAPQQTQLPTKAYIVDITPTNYNTYVYINSVEQSPTQGAQQFDLNFGDTLYVYAVNAQFGMIAYFGVKVDGILLYQSQNNSYPNFGYKAK